MNPVEALPRMVDKLHIDENTEGNVSGGEKSIEHVHDLNNITIPSYDIDRMTAEELQASLREIAEDARQPFSFLADISKEFTCDNYRLSMRTKTSTDIDVSIEKRNELYIILCIYINVCIII